jgi:hypothetical protein
MFKSISALASVVLVICCVVAALPQKPVNHGGKIETKYDGFSLETVMRLRKMKVTCDGFKDKFTGSCVSIDVALHCPGTQISHVKKVTLQVIFETKGGWNRAHDLDERTLSILADTDTLRIGQMKLITEGQPFLDSTASEVLEAEVSYNVFKKMVSAQSVGMQVGPSSFDLREKNILALRDLDSRIVRAQ